MGSSGGAGGKPGRGGGGGGNTISGMPNLPQDLSTMTKKQTKETVDYLVKNKTYDQLRKSQRLIANQQETAAKTGNTKASKNLEKMWQIHTAAISKQAFG